MTRPCWLAAGEVGTPSLLLSLTQMERVSGKMAPGLSTRQRCAGYDRLCSTVSEVRCWALCMGELRREDAGHTKYK